MRPVHYYLLGTGSWFIAFGIQGVLFAWLVAMELRASAEWVGVAQMTLLLPGTLLILIGGSYADRFGGRRVTMLAQGEGFSEDLMTVSFLDPCCKVLISRFLKFSTSSLLILISFCAAGSH